MDKNLDIKKADFSLYCVEHEGLESISQLYLVTSEWDVEYAHWFKAMENKEWINAGGDFSTTQIDSFTFTFTAAGQWENFDVTTEIKNFLKKPDSNFGFFIKMNISMNGIKYASSEYPYQIKRPKIKIMHGDGDYEPPEVTVNYPDGDEIFIADSQETITWTATDNEDVVAGVIYFAPDSWTGWQMVDSVSGNPGEYVWGVPNDKYFNCKIKIEVYDAVGNTGVDESNKPFDINKPSGIIPNNFNTDLISPYSVAIINIQGRVISSFKVNNLASINKFMASLPSGIHLVSIKTAGNVVIKKYRALR